MTENNVVPPRRSMRRRLPLLALPAVLVLSACGGGGTTSADAETGAGQDLEGECGSVPTVAPNDPDGVIPDLPEKIQTAFNGWPETIEASAWMDLESKIAEGPITVGYLQQDSGSPVAAALSEEINAQFEDSKSSGEVEKLLVETPGGTGGQLTAADQVRAFEQLVSKGADIIIAQPLSGEALVGAVNSAGEKGIPTVTFTGHVASPYAINITPNNFDAVAQAVAKGAEMIGGEGNAMVVQGVEGMTVSTASVDTAGEVLALCPDITLVGTPAGDFNDAAAKTSVVSFLASHPEDIDLVYQVASMGAGVFAGFEDAGRDDMPVVVDNLPTAASLAWWDQKRPDGYEGLALAGTGAQFGEALWDVAIRTMNGEKPQINQIALQQPYITAENVDEFLVPDEGVTSAAETQTVGSLLDPEYLDGYFSNPGE
ncbi:substrate-binding domain-containing protein [Nesterenkonia lutea]|uniref:Ribose transport system substrate-binding protein n=1 Tax=Nesterenkonia lutea TaxID=272919 RepID=A0ABR9JBS5_9MICC|nr:substrate-binding domain-containing protein [Nesterenkonia lutea]MBE1523387.1 ribose transport system substrate-binding protein [Nesterenkonia lutea]